MKSILKVIVSLTLFVVLLPDKTEAQILTRAVPAKDSAVNTETKYITFGSTPSGVVGLSLVGHKHSGTVDGYAIVQVRTDTMPTLATSHWEDYVYPGTDRRDTLFFANESTAQAHTWPIPVHSFNGVRFKVVTTGTQRLYLYGATLRR